MYNYDRKKKYRKKKKKIVWIQNPTHSWHKHTHKKNTIKCKTLRNDIWVEMSMVTKTYWSKARVIRALLGIKWNITLSEKLI